MLLKQRIIAIILALVSTFILYQTWIEARHGAGYSLKAATFTPLGIVAGIFLVLFPQFGGKPHTTSEKVIVLAVFAVGVVGGVFNRYLIDPRAFKF